MGNNYWDLFEFDYVHFVGVTVGSHVGFNDLAGAYNYATQHDQGWVRHTFKRTWCSEVEEEYIRLF